MLKYRVFHPAVDFHGFITAKTVEDAIREFCNPELACANPSNLDAALLYKRDRKKFNEINNKLYTEWINNSKDANRISIEI